MQQQLINPLGTPAVASSTPPPAGLINPLTATGPTVEQTAGGYELGNMDKCPDCGKPMEQLYANDVLSNVCLAHRICLPVKDKE